LIDSNRSSREFRGFRPQSRKYPAEAAHGRIPAFARIATREFCKKKVLRTKATDRELKFQPVPLTIAPARPRIPRDNQ
jgi:hypothetical protein